MKRDRFLADNIICEVYWNNTFTNKKLALYQYGFPGSNGKNPLITYLTDLGFTVIAPHFPGTFDSGGDLTPVNTYEFYKSIYEVLKNGELISLKKNKPLSISSYDIEYVFGHSYGCWSLLRGMQFLIDTKYLFLFGPAITYAETPYPTNCGLIENGKEHIEMVMRTRPYTYRLKDVELFDKLYRGDYDNFLIKNSSLKKITGIVGTEDPYFDFEKLKDRFSIILKDSFETNVSIELITVNGGTHSLESLLSDEFESELSRSK